LEWRTCAAWNGESGGSTTIAQTAGGKCFANDAGKALRTLAGTRRLCGAASGACNFIYQAIDKNMF
jgi:hypothetical protein